MIIRNVKNKILRKATKEHSLTSFMFLSKYYQGFATANQSPGTNGFIP